MALVDTSTGEPVVLMDKAAALKITADIKKWAGTLWLKIEEAHRGQAWRALGYESWAAYLDAEFDIGKSRGYQLVNHARAVRALADAAGVDSTMVELPERVTRDLDVDAAAAQIAASVTEESTTEERVKVTKTVVRERSETEEQKRERLISACIAAIAADPEADNLTVADRVKCSVTYVRAARQKIDQTAGAGAQPSPAEQGPPSPAPSTPPVEDEDAQGDVPPTASETESAGGSSRLPPADPPFDPVAYRDRGIDEELKVRRGLLTLNPDLLAETDRRAEWVDLARDLITWGHDVEKACTQSPNLRSVS